jgi:hypothetical protein
MQLPESATVFLSAMPATTNTGAAWRQAVSSLREAILSGCREGRLQVSIREPEASFIELASPSLDIKRAIKLRHCGVVLSAQGGKTTTIQLRSLFADLWDVDRNALDTGEEAGRWLADLRAVASPEPEALLDTWRRWKDDPADLVGLSGHVLAALMVFHYIEKKYSRDEMGTDSWQERKSWRERKWAKEFLERLGSPDRGGTLYKGILDSVKRATGLTIEQLASGLVNGTWPAGVHPTLSAAAGLLLADLGVDDASWPECVRDR